LRWAAPSKPAGLRRLKPKGGKGKIVEVKGFPEIEKFIDEMPSPPSFSLEWFYRQPFQPSELAKIGKVFLCRFTRFTQYLFDESDLQLSGKEKKLPSDTSEFSEAKGNTNQNFSLSDSLNDDEKRLVKVRRYQNKLRQYILQERGCCQISGIKISDFLEAAHIKPYSEDDGKVDPNNGLLLSQLWHKAFDKGYITFADDGTLLTSDCFEKMESSDKQIFTSSSFGKLQFINKHGQIEDYKVPEEMKRYLKYHRENIFKGTAKEN